MEIERVSLPLKVSIDTPAPPDLAAVTERLAVVAETLALVADRLEILVNPDGTPPEAAQRDG